MFFYFLLGIGILGFIPIYMAEDIHSFIFIMAAGTISGLSLVSFSNLFKKIGKVFEEKMDCR
ncbi:hypothetical protein [Halobacillus yeomjeoni]|uniref:Uncharacterized protein n=1 Tax=Halobacillus yeomjeoni TaxID=311194 RepID=A0A931MVT9_9BACI|nr:hypothetical protein [Halobacillus yeomjeoni]MBH0230776.1 hypothetical protein [Halobacillus yeomjeoni]